jgi:putative DNA primase/helicase
VTTPFDNVDQDGLAAVQDAAVDPVRFIAGGTLDRSEPGNADRLRHYYHDELRYIKKMKAWRNWDGRRWNPSTDADMMRVARRVVANIFVEATLAPMETADDIRTWAVRSACRAKMDNLVAIATGDDHFWRELGEFDANPYLLNFMNGTVDVRVDDCVDGSTSATNATRGLRPHDPHDYITQLIPYKYDPHAQAPMWNALVSRVVQTANQDGATLRFLQKALGYSLLGGNIEHVIFFLTGSERCGKSKILEIVRALVGEDYAHISRPDLISKKRNGHHDSELFSIVSKRLVLISEMSGAFAMDESQVKSLSGDPVQTARKLRAAEEIQVPMTWTIWLATNENPSVQNWDGAIAERVVVIPCGPTVPADERIPDLDTRIIQQEAEGVLAWLVEGARMWWRDMQESEKVDDVVTTGLARPPSVRAANASYAVDSDYYGQFIEDHIVMDDDARLRRPDVFDRFKKTRGPGEKPNRNKLYERLEAIPGVTLNSAREFVGIRLKTHSGGDAIEWSHLYQKAQESQE